MARSFYRPLSIRMFKAALKGAAGCALYFLLLVAYVRLFIDDMDVRGQYSVVFAYGFLSVIVTHCLFIIYCTHRRVRWLSFIVLSFFWAYCMVLASASLCFLLLPVTAYFTDQPVAEWFYDVFFWAAYVPYALLTLPPYIVFGVDYWRENGTIRQWFFEGRQLDAWAGPRTFDRLAERLKNKYFPWAITGVLSKNIIFGRGDFDDDPRTKLISTAGDPESNIVTIGGIGSGKSVTVAYPILMTYDKPIICVDIKGELARQSFFRRSSLEHLADLGLSGRATKHLPGGKALMLDPFGENPQLAAAAMCTTILDQINMNSLRCREMIGAISDGLVLSEGDKNKFFTESAANWIEGLITFVKTEYPENLQTLPFLFDMMQGIDPSTGGVQQGHFQVLLNRMENNHAAGGLCQQAAAAVKNMGNREFGAVFSTVMRSLKAISDEAMARTFEP